MARISSAAYVTAVLNFLQAFNRGDLDACESLLDPQVEWHSAVSHRGRGQVREMLEAFRAKFVDGQARPDDFRASGRQVLMIVCFHEADPGAPTREQRQSWIADIGDDGLIRRVLAYPSPADAARAFEGLADAAHRVHA